MKLLDIIRGKSKSSEDRLEELYTNAIVTRTRETVKVFEETGGATGSPMILSSASFIEATRHSTAEFTNYLTEKRVVTSSSYKNMTLMKSPYFYDRIDNFYSKESYFSRSIVRQIETMMRNGYDFISDDNQLLLMAKQELARVHMDSGVSTNQLIFSMTMHLLKYGMFIVHKVRESVKDDVAQDEKRRKRITKFRLINPHGVLFYVSQKGKVMGLQELKQTPFSTIFQKQFGTGAYGIPIEDLAIGYLYDSGDTIFPEPPCKPILDDIITLRSFEETIELLGFQFGSPLVHAMVGTDESPASQAEIAAVNDALRNVASNGMVTTDHRVKIEIKNLQQGAIDLIPYVEYFKNRVLIGSGSSPVSVGEGDSANRNTAESLDNALADRCTYLAGVVSDTFNYNILPDMIVKSESPYEYKDLFNEDGDIKIYMEFNEPTLEKKISRENSVINLWEGNLITLPQARKILKFPPILDGERNDLFVNIVSIPVKEAGGSALGDGESSSASGRTRSANQPQNQHGVKAGPGTRKN